MIFNNCGTYAGYQKHYRAKDKPCNPCKEANVIHYREYRKLKKDAINSLRKARYQANPKLQRQASNTYKKLNPEKAAYWRKINAEYDKLRKKKWAENNPDKVRAKSNRRRAAKLNAVSEFYTVEQVIKIYGSCCHICNSAIDLDAPRTTQKKNWEKGLQLDHVIPLSRGGSDTLDNIRPSHAICNIKKGNK